MIQLLRDIKEVTKKVRKPQYVALFLFTTIALYVLFSVLPHTEELRSILEFDNALGGGGSVLFTFLLSLLAHTATQTLFVTLFVSVLSAINIILLVLYYRERGAMLFKSSGSGFFGLVLGALGIGCSACGTLALTAVLGTLGLGWIVVFLPFHGAEIYALGILLLLFSIYQLIKLINKPLTC